VDPELGLDGLPLQASASASFPSFWRASAGDQERVTLETGISAAPSGEKQILSVHHVLEQLEEVDPRLVRVVEMRYFAGMTEPEIGQALGVTERTVRRDWEKARLLLAAALKS
jgi:RNA polymerase sigma factor (sigma-70 family)